MRLIILLTATLFFVAFSVSNASGEPAVQVSRGYFEHVVTSPCNGETIENSGYGQVVLRNHTDEQGRQHFAFRVQLVNVVGVGDYGNIYRLVGNVRQDNYPFDWYSWFWQWPEGDHGPMVMRTTITNQLVPVRGSDAPKYLYKVRAKLTISPDGTVVIDRQDFEGEITCDGQVLEQ